MEIQITKKKRFLFMALILGIYSAFGLCLDLQKKGIGKILERYEHNNFFTVFYAYFLVSLKKTSYLTVLFGIAAIMIFFLYCMVFAQHYKKREFAVNGAIALFFSMSIWFGVVFAKNDNWNDFIKNKYTLLKDFLFISGWFFLFLGMLLLFTAMIRKYVIDFSSKKKPGRKELLIVFFGTAGLILVLWIPYLWIFRPGVIHGDVLMQLLQYHHFPVSFQKRWVSDGVNIVFSNDHPFIHTILFGKAIDIGEKWNNLQAGIQLFSSIQVAAYIFAYAGLITTLYYFGVKRKFLLGASLIYGIIPIFPMYAFFIGGDSSLALVFIFYMISTIWIYQTNGEILTSKWFISIQLLAIFALAIIKNQGVYIAIVMIIVTMIIYRKYWKQNLIAMILPLLIFYIGYQGLFFQAMHIGNVGRQEALSLFFQQTARCVAYHDDEITKEEKEVISRILDYEIIKVKYDRNLSDKVKTTFKEEATSKDMKEYFVTWAKMGLKYPGEYVQSFVGNTWMYYSPICYEANIYYSGLSTLRYYCEIRDWTNEVIPKEFIEKMDWSLNDQRKEERDIAYHYLLLGKYIPVANWFVLPGCMTWIMFLSFLVMWIRKNYRMMIMFLPVFLVFGVCLLSPVNGNVRYLLPAYCIIPAMVVMSIGGKKE